MGERCQVPPLLACIFLSCIILLFSLQSACLLAREKVGALSAPDLSVLRRALQGDTTYSLGAIVARRLHINKSKGKIHCVIYTTRLPDRFNIQIRQHDYPFPKVHLD